MALGYFVPRDTDVILSLIPGADWPQPPRCSPTMPNYTTSIIKPGEPPISIAQLNGVDGQTQLN